MINYFSYTSQGTGFNTGLSSGSFTIPGNVSRGVPINQPMFYRFAPKAPGKVIEGTQDFSATPGTEYYKLINYDATKASLIQTPIGNQALMLDVGRTIDFTLINVSGDADVTIIVSYIDQYGQIGRRQSGDFTDNVSKFPVGVLGITAVEVIKNAGNTATFNIEMSTTGILELLYNDYGSPSTFMWFSVNIPTTRNISYPSFRTLAPNTPFLFIADLGDAASASPGYFNADQDPQTLTTGRPRPLIDLDYYPFAQNKTFSVVQNVLGIGMSSDGLPSINDAILTDQPIPTITYNQEVIFGRKNYTEGWKSFQG